MSYKQGTTANPTQRSTPDYGMQNAVAGLEAEVGKSRIDQHYAELESQKSATEMAARLKRQANQHDADDATTNRRIDALIDRIDHLENVVDFYQKKHGKEIEILQDGEKGLERVVAILQDSVQGVIGNTKDTAKLLTDTLFPCVICV